MGSAVVATACTHGQGREGKGREGEGRQRQTNNSSAWQHQHGTNAPRVRDQFGPGRRRPPSRMLESREVHFCSGGGLGGGMALR